MEKGRRSLLGLALWSGLSRVVAASPAAPSRPSHAALDAELAAIVNDPALQLASLSVLAVRMGKVAYGRQFGQRFLGAPGVPARPADERTLYRIASISKMMTTLALMRLVEQGKVDLDADAGAYLGFALRNPHFPGRAVTLRALLSHTSSLRDAAGYSWPCAVSLSSVLSPGGESWARNAGPGEFFTYSNLGWGVIGTIMERVTGERFDRLMKRLLLDPLGMRGGFHPSEFPAEDLSNLATLYRKRTTDTEIWNPAGPWIAQVDDFSAAPPARPAGIDRYVVGSNATPFSPTGGLRVSAAGMGTVMLMLLNEGRHGGAQFLQPATLRLMATLQWSADGRGGNGDTDRGLFNRWGPGIQHFPDLPGMRLVEGGGFSGIGHLGEAYGLMSVFVVDPVSGNGIIMLAGGVSSDPEAQKGQYSAMPRFQERILTAIHRRVLA